jgi:hypothetical protein
MKLFTFRRAGCAGRYEWGAAPGVNQQSTGNLARQPLLKGAVCKVPCIDGFIRNDDLQVKK